ncbi:MAG: DUF1292 domain-containing protein [Sedimentibacter sp.]|uniref:DUF1292 domain-containing protein n=1 Tax=Sedimentibacter sp. TaxID=1960295 RepID=UPI00315947D8
MEDNIIELINEEGKTEKLVVEATFHIDDTMYAVLHEIGSDEGMIFYVEEAEDGNGVFIPVEDEEEIQEVIEVYEGIADDLI